MKINEEFIDNIEREDVQRSSDEDRSHSGLQYMLRLNFPFDDISSETFKKFLRAVCNRLENVLETSPYVPRYNTPYCGTDSIKAAISLGIPKIEIKDGKATNMPKRVFIAFEFDATFKSAKSLIRFFFSINKSFWKLYYIIVKESDDFFYIPDLFKWNSSEYEYVDLDGFEDFMDKDLMRDNTYNFFNYYKAVSTFIRRPNIYDAICEYCDPQQVQENFLQAGLTLLVGNGQLIDPYQLEGLEKSINKTIFHDLSDVFNKKEYEEITFLCLDADKDPEYETFTVGSREVRDFIVNDLNGLKGYKPKNWKFFSLGNEWQLYFYIGCYWIKDIHIHLAVEVTIPKYKVVTQYQVLNKVFGYVPNFFALRNLMQSRK